MNVYYLYALSGSTAFAISSNIFRHYGRKLSAYWVNALKNTVALVAFGIMILANGDYVHVPSWSVFSVLAISGIVGLTIGDYFLIKAFSTVGPSRTFMIFNFEPIFLGIAGFFLFGQTVTSSQLISIIFMMGCVFTLTLEMQKKEKSQRREDMLGLMYAVILVIFDAAALIIVRAAFEMDPELTTTSANFFRTLAAILGFIVASRFLPLHFWSTFRSIPGRDRSFVVFAAFLGTFLGLYFRLAAISKGHLATVMAIGGTSPVIAAIIEAAVEKKWPSRYLLLALAFFAVGFLILVYG